MAREVTDRDDLDRNERITALFESQYTGLCRLAFLILGDRTAAEEVVMDAFLRTFVAWRRIRDLDSSAAYLRRGVVNLSRSRSRRRRVEDRSNASVARRPPAPAAWDQDSHANDRVVWDAVRALPLRQRAAVALRYYADLSEADIAETLGCSAGTVKSNWPRPGRASAGRWPPSKPPSRVENRSSRPSPTPVIGGRAGRGPIRRPPGAARPPPPSVVATREARSRRDRRSPRPGLAGQPRAAGRSGSRP